MLQPLLICIILELGHNPTQDIPRNTAQQQLLKLEALCLILIMSTIYNF